MEATTTRPVTFATTGTDTVRRGFTVYPTGTRVYVRETRRGFEARIPGTLQTQIVGLDALDPS